MRLQPAISKRSQMSQMGARVVPAKLELPGPTQSSAGSCAIRSRDCETEVEELARGELNLRSSRHALSSTRADGAGAAPYQLIRAGVTAVAPQALFFVMRTEVVQTRQYDASGAVVWDLCVWRVTVVGPVQKQDGSRNRREVYLSFFTINN